MTYEFRFPASMMIEAGNDRLKEEARVLNRHFQGWTVRRGSSAGDFGIVRGTLAVDFARSAYQFEIVLPPGYPHKLPRVVPVGWVPRSNPHIINGGLCVMKETQWHSFMSAAFLVAKSALWINKYEIYLDKGIWPGGEQHDHGLGYKARKWWHGL